MRDLVRDFDLVPFLTAYNDNLEKTIVGGERELSDKERSPRLSHSFRCS